MKKLSVAKNTAKLAFQSIFLAAWVAVLTGCDPASIGFYGESSNPSPANNTTPNNAFNPSQDYWVSYDDTSNFGYSVTQNGSWGQMRFEHTIDVPASSITQIDLIWIGRGVQQKPNGANSIDGASMYIWNYASDTYELLAASPNTESEVTLTATLTSSLTDYLDDTNQDTGVLLISTNSKKTGTTSLTLYTDYVAVTVTSVPTQDTLQIFSGSGTASTCQPRSITINVCSNPTCTALNTNYTGTINLSTSSNQGNWVSQGLGTLVPNPDNNDDGAASYTFSASDSGTVTLDLFNEHAGSLTITAENAANGDTVTSSAIDFQDNAFVISDIDTISSSDVVVAGRNHRYQAALWRRDTSQSPADCAVATGYNGSKAVKAWRTLDPLDPGGNAPKIAAVALPNSIPGATNLSLNFTGGLAEFDLTTEDVGKYALNIADDSGTFASQTISGVSAVQTVRPFGLGFTNIIRISDNFNNPGGTASSGDGFAAAGEAFGYQIGGYLYSSADDSGDDGVPDTGSNVTDNGSTPRFAASVSLGINSITPATGTAGNVTPTIISAATFSGGSSTVSNGTYSEVGSVIIAASSVDYLGNTDADIIGLSPVIGRFYPAELVLAAPAPPATSNFTETNTPSLTCTDGFVYMEEPALTLSFNLEAKNSSGNVTANYSAALGYNYLATPELVAEADDNGVDLPSTRLNAPVSFGNWSTGVLSYSATDHYLSRGLTPDYAASLAVGVQISNLATSDNVDIASLDMHPTQTPNCGVMTCTAKALTGTVDVRYGRMVVNNAYGPENQDLNVPLHSEYYDGSSFVINTLDNCSSYSDSAATLDFAPYADNLDSGETAVALLAATPLVNGRSNPAFPISLNPPGAGNDGKVDLTLDVPAWLEYDWNGLGVEDPKGTASFGHYRGHDRIIYWREAH